jgi:hypothetical protein
MGEIGLEVLEGFGGVLGLLGLGEPFGEGEGVGAPGVLAFGELGGGGLAEGGEGLGEGLEGLVEGVGEVNSADGGFLGASWAAWRRVSASFALVWCHLLVHRLLVPAHGAVAVAVLFVEAEGVVEEGGELVGLPRHGLGGGFVALVGVAEGLGGLGDGVLVGGLEGGQAASGGRSGLARQKTAGFGERLKQAGLPRRRPPLARPADGLTSAPSATSLGWRGALSGPGGVPPVSRRGHRATPVLDSRLQ